MATGNSQRVKAGSMIYHYKNYQIICNLVHPLFSFPKVTLGYDVDCCVHTTCSKCLHVNLLPWQQISTVNMPVSSFSEILIILPVEKF